MHSQVCLSILALALTGCAQTGQSPFEANLSSEMSAVYGRDTASGPQIGALGSVAQVEAGIPGNFIPPDEAPIPLARPDYGDRPAAVMLAQVGNASAQESGITRVAAFAPAAGPAPGIAGVSLAAYERREAGIVADPAAPGQKTQAQSAVALAPSGAAGRRWRPAYPHVQTECFPAKLRAALERIGDHFDAEVLVTSGKRDRGRRGSLHRSCKAADIRVAGVSPQAVAQFARRVPGVNGVGSYRWASLTHIDIRDEHFAWRW